MKITYVEVGLVGLVGVTVLLLRTPQHEVKYGVSGSAGSKYVVISYVDTPHYGGLKNADHAIKRVRIPATSLPWSAVVYLPKDALAWVSVENEHGATSRFYVSLKVNGIQSTGVLMTPSVSNENSTVVGGR